MAFRKSTIEIRDDIQIVSVGSRLTEERAGPEFGCIRMYDKFP